MLTETEYAAFKELIQNLEKKVTESEGAAKQIRKELSRDFGCKSLDDAHKLLKKLKKELADAEVQFAKELKAFTKVAKKNLKRSPGVEIDIPRTLDLLSRLAKATKRRTRKGKKAKKRS